MLSQMPMYLPPISAARLTDGPYQDPKEQESSRSAAPSSLTHGEKTVEVSQAQ
jgi:hypothetical protein